MAWQTLSWISFCSNTRLLSEGEIQNQSKELLHRMKLSNLKLNPDKSEISLARRKLDSGTMMPPFLDGTAFPKKKLTISCYWICRWQLKWVALCTIMARVQLESFLSQWNLVTIICTLVTTLLIYVGRSLKSILKLQLVQNETASFWSGMQYRNGGVCTKKKNLHWLLNVPQAQLKMAALTFKSPNCLLLDYLGNSFWVTQIGRRDPSQDASLSRFIFVGKNLLLYGSKLGNNYLKSYIWLQLFQHLGRWKKKVFSFTSFWLLIILVIGFHFGLGFTCF